MATHNESRPRILSPARKCLIELMREIGYGRIYGLTIRDGEPVLSPRPRIALSHKFGGDHSRPPRACDTALKQAHLDLLLLFDEIGNGTIDELTITNGLPLHAERSG
jgi:hypothetical protein